MKARHPVQPLVKCGRDRFRFKQNAIVRFFVDNAHDEYRRRYDLNRLACMPFSDEDREQLAMLIGYSLDGFAELSYVSDETYARASEQIVPPPDELPTAEISQADAQLWLRRALAAERALLDAAQTKNTATGAREAQLIARRFYGSGSGQRTRR